MEKLKKLTDNRIVQSAAIALIPTTLIFCCSCGLLYELVPGDDGFGSLFAFPIAAVVFIFAFLVVYDRWS
jgi:hypothetical protein